MKLYDSCGKLISVSSDFMAVPPDDNVVDLVRDICPDADVVLRSNACVLDVTDRKLVKTMSGTKGNMVCGLKVLFNPIDGKFSGLGFLNCPSDKYAEGCYAVIYGIQADNIPSGASADFAELATLAGCLSDLDKGDLFAANKDALILDRLDIDIDKQMRWESYLKIKKFSENAHFKDNLIYFKVKDNGQEGIVRMCSDGRYEYRGRYYRRADLFLADFKKDVGVDPKTYGGDERFAAFAKDIKNKELYYDEDT